MFAQKRSLRPLETLSKREREALYAAADLAIRNYHYVSQTTRLLKKEKREREVDEQLGRKRDEIDEKASKISDQDRMFRSRLEEMKERLNTKEPIILNYERKKKQEEEKFKKEEELIRIKDDEIRKKQEILQKEEEKLDMIERKIQKYSKYKEFLDQVIEDNHEDFRTIPDLMQRYQSLKQSIHDLNDGLKKLENTTQEENHSFDQYIKAKRDEIAVNTGKMHKLENDIELMTTELTRIENEKEDARQENIIEKGTTGKVVLSIKNMYNNIVKESKQSQKLNPFAENADLLAMLTKIQHRIEDLKKITAEDDSKRTEFPQEKPKPRRPGQTPVGKQEVTEDRRRRQPNATSKIHDFKDTD